MSQPHASAHRHTMNFSTAEREATTDAQTLLLRSLPCTCEKCSARIRDAPDRVAACFAAMSRGAGGEGGHAIDEFVTQIHLLDRSGHDESIDDGEDFGDECNGTAGARSMPSQFFAAAYHDLGKACHLLTASLLWRAEVAILNGTAMTRAERRAVVDRHYTMGLFHGGRVRDRGGRPIWIERTGLSDYNVVTANQSVFQGETIEETFLRAHADLYLQAQRLHPQRMFIYDMRGLSTFHVTPTAMSIIRSMADLDQRNFPGTLYKVFIVNAPLIFQAAFALVSYMLDEETAAKVQVVGYPLDDDEALATLLEEIDEDVLPEFLGGKGIHAKGGLPLHWVMRRGELPLDEEMRLEIASGTVVVASASWDAYCGDEKDYGVNDKFALVLRSLSFNVNVEVCFVTRIAGTDVPVVVLPSQLVECHGGVMSLPLSGCGRGDSRVGGEEDNDNFVGIRLRFDHTAMWRMRTVFFEVPGVAAEAWSVRIEA